MDRTPSARAANSKDFLAYLEKAHPGALAHLQETEPSIVEAIQGSARTDWIAIDVIGDHVTAIVQWLGEDAARHAWRKYTSEHLVRSPALKSLVDGTVRLFGVSVRAFVWVIPFAFQQSYRGCGTMDTTWGDREATITLSGIPIELARFRAYAVLFEGVFQGVCDFADATPQLDYRPDLAKRRIVARFRW